MLPATDLKQLRGVYSDVSVMLSPRVSLDRLNRQSGLPIMRHALEFT